MKLIESIINSVSSGLLNVLDEMARTSLNKTIDKNLWATVSSTCSRNKSTEAEFIKPVGGDKDNLVARYVAALLIMKKQCPSTEEDIDTIKTFKLVAKKALELGATIEDIQNLYNQNTSGATSTNNNKGTLEDLQEDIKSEEPHEDTMSSYDSNDIFGGFDFSDDTGNVDFSMENTVEKLTRRRLDDDLTAWWVNNMLLKKPYGLNLVKHTDTSYEKYEKYDTTNSLKINENIIGLIKEKGWTFFGIESEYIKGSFAWISRFDYNWFKDDSSIKFGNLSGDDVNRFIDIRQKFKQYISSIQEPIVKEAFKKNPRIIELYLSPDKKVMFYKENVATSDAYKDLYIIKNHRSYYACNFVLTFTGYVEYDEINQKITKNVDIKNGPLPKAFSDKVIKKAGQYIEPYIYEEFVKKTASYTFKNNIIAVIVKGKQSFYETMKCKFLNPLIAHDPNFNISDYTKDDDKLKTLYHFIIRQHAFLVDDVVLIKKSDGYWYIYYILSDQFVRRLLFNLSYFPTDERLDILSALKFKSKRK